MTQRTVTTDSGEVLGSTAIGDPVADRLVILFPPTPGAGGFDPDPLVTSRWGVQVVTLDRPGYAATPAPPVGGPATLDAVVDGTMAYLERVERTADRVSKATFDRIGVIGWGEGGAYAAALAGRHPERVDRLVLVGTPRPSARGP